MGRELEIAELLYHVKRHRVTGMVWVTGDVHYTAAHHYQLNQSEGWGLLVGHQWGP